MRLTFYGLREWLGAAIIAAIAVAGLCAVAAFGGFPKLYVVAGGVFLVWCLLAAFFRDPERRVPADPDALVAPADGVVRDIEILEDFEHDSYFLGRRAVRVGIFLSVLDVHLNRAPCDMMVVDSVYKPGAFHDARDVRASKENESNALLAEADMGQGRVFPLIVRQISGAIAKRIVCAVGPGASLKKGDRFGMIKFGSRTELYLPACPEMELAVNVGDRVWAGVTVVARMQRKEAS